MKDALKDWLPARPKMHYTMAHWYTNWRTNVLDETRETCSACATTTSSCSASSCSATLRRADAGSAQEEQPPTPSPRASSGRPAPRARHQSTNCSRWACCCVGGRGAARRSEALRMHGRGGHAATGALPAPQDVFFKDVRPTAPSFAERVSRTWKELAEQEKTPPGWTWARIDLKELWEMVRCGGGGVCVAAALLTPPAHTKVVACTCARARTHARRPGGSSGPTLTAVHAPTGACGGLSAAASLSCQPGCGFQS